MNPNDERRCGSCGQPLVAGASFCRSCGARWELPSCTACGAPIAPSSAFCRSCGASIAAATSAQQPPAPQKTVASAPPPERRRAPLWIGAAVLLLGVGAAAAIVLSGGGGRSTTTVAEEAPPTRAEQAAETTVEREVVEPEPEPVADALPAVSRFVMEEEIEAVLLAYHEDVVRRDFRTAWALLSERKRRQNLAEYGYGEWKRAQASLSDDLYPSGLRARIDSIEDRSDGVARVSITGMGWSAPSSPCSEWSGLTWVKYERGTWTYDPGYSTTPARRRVWESRAGRLLGAGC
jgi:hypothetical protein